VRFGRRGRMNSPERAAPTEQELDLPALVRVLWAYKYFIVGVTVAAGLVAVALALTATPIYRAEVVVTEVRDDNMNAAASIASQLGGLASLAGMNLNSGSSDRNSKAVLESRRLAEEFAQRHDLQSLLLPDATDPTLWFAVRKFREEVLSISFDTLKGTATIGMNWTDPSTAAQWANDYVHLANELVRGRAIDDASRNIAYLNNQIAETTVVELQRVVYNLIENETKALMLAKVRDEYAFAVVDPAVPPEVRSSPRRTLMVLLGLALGAALSAVFAVSHNLWRWHRLDVL
jgi:uncharacterized protein involved in exopolysaccharide biosynthesis